MRGLDRFFQALLAQEASFSGKKGTIGTVRTKLRTNCLNIKKTAYGQAINLVTWVVPSFFYVLE